MKTSYSLGALLAAFLLGSCSIIQGPGGDSGMSMKGSISIRASESGSGSTPGSRSILPDLSDTTDPARPIVLYKGYFTTSPAVLPVSAKDDRWSDDGNFTLSDLPYGEYIFVVEGVHDRGSAVIVSGSAAFTIGASSPESMTIVLAPASGTGTFALSVTWPSSKEVDSVSGSLSPQTGVTATAVSCSVGASGASLSMSVPSGSYLLLLNFTKNGKVVSPPMIEAVRVFAGYTSTGAIGLAAERFSGYSITYNPNVPVDSTGQSGLVPADSTVYQGGATARVLANPNALAVPGMYLHSWNSSADGSGTTYSAGSTLVMGAINLDLYAIWKIANFSVTYTLNSGVNNAANPATYSITSAAITLATPTRTNYDFGGWYSDSGLTSASSSIASGSTGDKAFYAKWTATPYTLTYSLDGGTNATANPATYNVTSAAITLADPTRAGYTFVAWYSDSGLTTPLSSIASNSTGAKAFYAEWALVSYNITYTLNSGTNDSANPTSYTVTSAAITLASPTRTGYNFGGWYSDSGLTSASSSIATGSTADKAFYAKWIPAGNISIAVSLPSAPTASSLVFRNSSNTTITSVTVTRGSSTTINTSFTATSYAWSLDNNTSTYLTNPTSSSCTITPSTTLALGQHLLLLDVVTAAGKKYSGRLVVQVVTP
ncbi:MAG: InlB B-repeat-containing protein [Rectinemataceae bacterium]